ncbi:hypothetical protein H634G_02529 [Metarhizium anisopliae BRIP 53293]|uniref:DUF7735 domain-containing protein n=1 Tax=Metarhizium anisopliae BRIP 53293 TaxID=1291518 RepID=A0A0D9PBZ7_METAN|nr:hypothetical protein H634G_02529 [Metarhizium anisopliae BRIP 53293]KJK87490.1 hypothetical protein H633G_08655 [Metarhizium anisopliae BRIP 53284]
MQTKTVLAVLAGTAFAANLQPRQTDLGAATQCLDLLKTIPTPPPDLTKEWMTNPPKDYCSISIPASLSKDWSSYTSSASSWVKAHSSDLAKCPGGGQVTAKSPLDCKAGSGSGTQATATSGTQATATSGSATGASQPTKTGAASRETGMAFAAVAAAGFALAAL